MIRSSLGVVCFLTLVIATPAMVVAGDVTDRQEQLVFQPRDPGLLDFSFLSPTPVKEIYRALGKGFGFEVVFDTRLKDEKLTIELQAVNAEQALELVATGAGHLVKPIGEHMVVVAEDNPQNRREYEELAIKTWVLAHADVGDVDKALRSMIEARRVATSETQGIIMVRDMAEKILIADRLVNLLDRPRGEVEIELAALALPSETLDSALDRTAAQHSDRRTSRYRLTPQEYQRLLADRRVQVCALPNLDVIGGTEAGFSSYRCRGTALSATIYARPVPGTQEVILELHASVGTTQTGDNEQGAPQSMTSHLRLDSGTTHLVTLQAPGTDGTVLVLAVTPTTVRVAEYDPGELDPLWVGSESRIHLAGRSMLISPYDWKVQD